MQTDVLVERAAIDDHRRIIGDTTPNDELIARRIEIQIIGQLEDQYFMMCRRSDGDETRNDYRPTTRFVRLCTDTRLWAQLFAESNDPGHGVFWGVRRLWDHEDLKAHWVIVDRASLVDVPSGFHEVVPEDEPEPKTERTQKLAEEYGEMAIVAFVAAGRLTKYRRVEPATPENLIEVGKLLLELSRS